MTDSRQRTELEGALKNEEHKQRQLQKVQQDFAALLAGVLAMMLSIGSVWVCTCVCMCVYVCVWVGKGHKQRQLETVQV